MTTKWLGLAFVVSVGACVEPGSNQDLVVHDAVWIGDTARYEVSLGGVERTVEVTDQTSGERYVSVSDGEPVVGALDAGSTVTYVDLVVLYEAAQARTCADAATCGADPVEATLAAIALGGGLPEPTVDLGSLQRREIGGASCFDQCQGNEACYYWCTQGCEDC